jgi:hypothetical protein
MLFRINNSYLYYDNDCGIINDYYQMIVELIKHFLYNNPEISINIILSNNFNNGNFNNSNKTLVININYEHTIVKKGGRDVPNGTPTGKLIDDDNNNYFVRIDRYHTLKNSDIIIDYSIPNIQHVNSCDLFKSFSAKHIYISSSIHDSYFIKENRNITTLTTFINTNEPRRALLLENIKKQHINHINVNNCFEKTALQDLYKNTKILINIHQTDHHHTFEELRVLPALQCGVIVICENSPLSEFIPYNDYIIWTSYDKILEKTIEVIHNYDYYHNLIFNNEKKNKLSDFNITNYNTLNDIIKQNI